MTSAAFQNRLAARAEAAGVNLRPDLTERLEAYYHLLSGWNEKINLTAIDLRELPPPAVDRLFIEPVAAARYAPSGCRTIDIGSGGGSPAIPFALAANVSTLVMVESRTRKSVFLREAARVVALPDVTVVTGRFEGLVSTPEHFERYDVVTVRAVRVEADQQRELLRLLKTSGFLFLFGSLVTGKSDENARRVRLTEASELEIVSKQMTRGVPRGTSFEP